MNKKQIENYIGWALVAFSILIFIVTPAHPTEPFHFFLNSFMDKYMLGNGFYIATAYPFTAKVTNNFTVAIALIMGVWVGIWRRNCIIKLPSKNIWLGIGFLVVLFYVTFSMSYNHQEFYESTFRRGFGTSESFHNTPVLFLFMIVMKQICLYAAVRALITLLLYRLSKIKNNS